MFQIITIVVFLIYLGLVYKFRKNNIVLLLLTLVAILSLCNLKNINVEGQSQESGPAPVSNNSPSNSPKSANSPKKTNDNGPQANDKMRFIVAAGYQMGPYDGLKLTLDNPLSKYVKLNDVSLASKEDMCVYQGIDVPLDCDKTLYSGMGPSITGVVGDDQNMFMLYRNKSSPECCPSTYTTSTGCVCTTQEQRDYVNRRGMVSAPPPPKPSSSNNSNQ